MGVQTEITLQEVQALFPHFTLSNLEKTADGVMDTTYLLDNYVLKRYERDIDTKVEVDAQLLKRFSQNGLNTPLHLASSKEWHLYSRLQGKSLHTTRYFHIQALARFLASLHTLTYKKEHTDLFLEEYDISDILMFSKKHHYYYYKKLQSLQGFQQKEDGFIHGDIFKDNTLFDGEKIGVFDFIDGGIGAFSFDVAVALMAFNPYKKISLTRLFINTYNQRAPQKISLPEIQEQIQNAAKLYALLRIQKYKNPKKAKQLANLW
jgi:homoserine kinase type II